MMSCACVNPMSLSRAIFSLGAHFGERASVAAADGLKALGIAYIARMAAASRVASTASR